MTVAAGRPHVGKDIEKIKARLRRLESMLRDKPEQRKKPTLNANSVVAETGWNQASIIGTSSIPSPQDHSHGTPPYPQKLGYHCEIYRTTNQSVPENTDTQIGFDFTNDANVSDLRSGSTIVVPQTGRYLIYGLIKWEAQYADANYGGYKSLHIAVNGGIIMDHHKREPETLGSPIQMTNEIARVRLLTAGDVVTALCLHQHNATNLNLNLEGGTAVSAFLGITFQTL